MQQQEDQVKKSDKTKIYFLSIAIIALLSTNAYFYFKDQRDSNKFTTVSTEKDKLELEVEKIEVELDKISAINVNLNERLFQEQQLAREKIAALKELLNRNKPTTDDIDQARTEVERLREFVKNFSNQVFMLQQQNGYLQNELDSLQKFINITSEKTNSLQQKNTELKNQIKSNEALVVSTINIQALKIKGRKNPLTVNKASTAESLEVKFEIAPNNIAPKEYHNVYLRVIDPAGNLIADNDNIFYANRQELQYSLVTTINYNNDGTIFKIDWVNPNEFIKGTYNLFLYANGKTIGNKSIELR